MDHSKTTGRIIFLLAIMSASGLFSQTLVLKDSVIAKLGKLPGENRPLIRYRLSQELSYAVNTSGSWFVNPQNDEKRNSFSIIQQLNYKLYLKNHKSVSLTGSFSHLLGLQVIFDSISWVHPDENVLETKLTIRIYRELHVLLFSGISTRVFNSYAHFYQAGGDRERILVSSFLTPLFWSLSGGVSWKVPGLLSVDCGVSAAKLTCLVNKRVYTEQETDVFFGVPRDKGYLFEYGLSLRLLVDRDFLRNGHWNCDLTVFKDFNRPVDVTLKSLLGVKISRYLKTSLQTRVVYQEEISRKLQIENTILFGFSLSL